MTRRAFLFLVALALLVAVMVVAIKRSIVLVSGTALYENRCYRTDKPARKGAWAAYGKPGWAGEPWSAAKQTQERVVARGRTACRGYPQRDIGAGTSGV